MCNVYAPPSPERLGRPNLKGLYGAYVAPLKPGPYLTAGDVIVGQWGMIGPKNKTRKPFGMTNNARRETMATLPTYRGPWSNGQRCLIPADAFDEPYYPNTHIQTKSIGWRFWRADGEPWMLAGLWAEWTDPETGELVPNYTMITQNCDGHPLLSLMHKPERDKEGQVLLPQKQDKRAVVPLERERWDEWLHGSVTQADALIQLPTLEVFRHGAADMAKSIPLPGVAYDSQILDTPRALF